MPDKEEKVEQVYQAVEPDDNAVNATGTKALEAEKLHRATIEMLAAINGEEGLDFETASANGINVYSWMSHSKYRLIRKIVGAFMLLTPVFVDIDGGLMNATVWLCIDVLCLTFYFVDFIFLCVMYGTAGVCKSHRWSVVRFLCVFIVGMGLPAYADPTYGRTFWAFRPLLFLTVSSFTRTTMATMADVLKALAPLLVFVAFVNCVLALMGFIVLDNADDTSGFHDFTDSYWTVSVMFLSVAKAVSVANPMLDSSEGFYYSIYFVFFTLFCCFFLTKLLVGRSSGALDARLNKFYFSLLDNRHRASRQAFSILAKDGRMDEETFVALFLNLRPIMGKMGSASVFRSLCYDDEDTIDFQSFSGCFWVLDQEWTRTRNPRDALHNFYTEHHGAHSKDAFMSGLSGCMMFLRQLLYELSTATIRAFGEDLVFLDLVMFSAAAVYIFVSPEPFIVGLFTAEIFCKLYAFGIENYFRYNMNQIDFWTIVLYFIDLMVSTHAGFLHFLVVSSRLLRATMLLLRMTSYTRTTIEIVGHILPILAEFALVWLGGIYFFAMLSQDIYGDVLMNCREETCDPLLETTGWYGGSAAQNFGSSTSSFMAMFYTQAAQSWFKIMDAPAVFGTSEKYFARVWFFCFVFIVKVVLITVGLALIVKLWNGFSVTETVMLKSLGDFEAHARSNKLYILRKLYGEAALRKQEGRKLCSAMNPPQAGSRDEEYHKYIEDRASDLTTVLGDIKSLEEALDRTF